MGLLDDAIREHLELKRRRSPDSGDTTRQEHEALGAGHGVPDAGTIDHAATPDADERGGEKPAIVGRPAYDENLASTSEETAELDMGTVLDPSASGGDPKPDSSAGGAGAGDSLEWEMPKDRRRNDGEIEDASSSREDDAGEPVEDVLEETPEFLRDTPDQDRLWFEQQPPRDFDFDK